MSNSQSPWASVDEKTATPPPLGEQYSTSLPPSDDYSWQSRREPEVWQFKFYGKGGEYFKIWIVNFFLTIVTLTLYSPWAKVRRLRYFYGNTTLNNTRFDFTAIPLRILMGRLLALVIFAMTAILQEYSPSLYILAFIILTVLFVPWIFRSTLRFNARNSKYGNARFYFSASLGETYKVFLKCALIIIFSLGLLYPVAYYWYKRYQVNHLQVGRLKFNLTATVSDFYKAILLPYIIMIGVIVVAGILFAILASALGGDDNVLSVIIFSILGIVYILSILLYTPLTRGFLFKAVWHNAEIQGSRIDAENFSIWAFVRLCIVNQLAIIFSLGLLYPWTVVRTYKFKAESLRVMFNSDPNQLVSLAQQDQSSLGEELADVFDIDIAI